MKFHWAGCGDAPSTQGGWSRRSVRLGIVQVTEQDFIKQQWSFLAHSHARPLGYCLWLFTTMVAELRSHRDSWISANERIYYLEYHKVNWSTLALYRNQYIINSRYITVPSQSPPSEKLIPKLRRKMVMSVGVCPWQYVNRNMDMVLGKEPKPYFCQGWNPRLLWLTNVSNLSLHWDVWLLPCSTMRSVICCCPPWTRVMMAQPPPSCSAYILNTSILFSTQISDLALFILNE